MDIEAYLQHMDIDFIEGGNKNTSTDWISINCPFCADNDPSFHMGIHLITGVFKCWVCGEVGNLVKLVKQLENVNWGEARRRSKSFKPALIKDVREVVMGMLFDTGKQGEVQFEKIPLPEGAKSLSNGGCPGRSINYLRRRGLGDADIKKYDLYYCGKGKYKNRIIFPVYDEVMDLVGFTSRDITGRANIKYVHPKGFNIKDYLYGIHMHQGDDLLLVEGCFDAIRTGGIALFNAEISSVQTLKIRDMYKWGLFKRLIIAMDGDAYSKALKIQAAVQAFLGEVLVLELPMGKDPANLGREGISALIPTS